MKILKGLVVVSLCVAVVLGGFIAGTKFAKKDEVTPVISKINELEKQVQEYKEKDIAEIERKEELKKIADPQIILEKLQSKGKIISYEGGVNYNNYVKEKTLLGNRELFLELKYKYGISMDLENIDIINIEDKGIPYGIQVDVRIPKQYLQLEYISLLANESSIDSDKTLFATKFESDVYQNFLQIAEDRVREEITANDKMWFEAHENLKMDIADLLVEIKKTTPEFDFDCVSFID